MSTIDPGGMGRKILLLSRWIDGDDFSEAQQWHRVGKCAEEAGEALQALLGVTGRNPRKGVSHTPYDLEKELCDVAVSALGAMTHLHGNDPDYDPMVRLNDALDALLERAGVQQ